MYNFNFLKLGNTTNKVKYIHRQMCNDSMLIWCETDRTDCDENSIVLNLAYEQSAYNSKRHLNITKTISHHK